MDRVLRVIRVYWWELSLVALGVIAVVGATMAEVTGTVFLAVALVLAFLLPKMPRPRRLLRAVLWLGLLVVATLLATAFLIGFADSPFGTEGVGLLLTVAALAGLLVVIGTAPYWIWGTRVRLWQYRWEALPLVVSLVAAQAWRLLPPPDMTSAPFGSIDVGFHATWNGLAAAPLALGLAWCLWRSQTMLAGLWVVVLLHRLVLLYTGSTFHLLLWPPPSTFASLLSILALQVPAVMLVALVVWRLASHGRWHAMVIATAFLAWTYVPYTAPWQLEPDISSATEYTLASSLLALWAGTFAGLAVVFHRFRQWDQGQQRLAVTCLVAVALAAQLLDSMQVLLGQYNASGGEGFLELLSPGFWSFSVYIRLGSALFTGGLLLSITWLVTKDRESLRPQAASG